MASYFPLFVFCEGILRKYGELLTRVFNRLFHVWKDDGEILSKTNNALKSNR